MAGENDPLLLQVSADIRSLQRQFDKAVGVVDKGSAAMERRAQKAASNLDRFFGKADPGKALDKIFDATRFKVLDSGVARVGVFGSALESLGASGLIAAAGVGAVGVALSGARDAAKFADDISDTAKRLHITTDALQEYRYAIRAAGGEEQGADEALDAFNVTLGKAAAGVPKALKPFQELFGKTFGKEQVKALGDNQHAIEAITKALEGLPDVQKDAVLSQFGLDGLKPLLEGGLADMQRLQQEAHKLGLVMDSDLVKRGGDLNDEFETVEKVINLQLKSALVDLGPVLLGLLKLVGDLAKFAADVADSFRSIDNKSTGGLERRRATVQKELDILLNAQKTSTGVSPLAIKNKREEISKIDAQLATRAEANKPPPIKPTKNLIDVSKTPTSHGPRDDTQERIEQINATLAGSGKDLLQSMLGLVTNVDDRAAIEKEIAEQEKVEALAKLNKDIAALKGDKGFKGDKQAELAKLEIAKINVAEAAEARQRFADQQAADQKTQDALSVRENDLDLQEQILQIGESFARSAAERRDIELKLLDLADKKLEAEYEAVIASQTAKDVDKQIAQAKLDQLHATRGGREAQVLQNTQGPIENYLDKLPKTADEINEAFQNAEANGISSLIDGLAEAGAGAKNLGDVFRNVLLQMAQDANRILLQSLLSGVTGGGSAGGLGFLSSLFGGGGGGGFASGFLSAGGFGGPITELAGLYAGGTDYTAPGDILVGENGPEILRQRGGHQVIPNDILRSIARLGLAGRTGGTAQAGVSHTWNVNVVAGAGMSPVDARRTGRQIAAAASLEMARARRAGY